MKTKISSTFKKYSAWCLTCIYCSPSTGQILIGKTNSGTKESKIDKYNKQGKLEQSIKKNNNEQPLYNFPGFITENNNGDVVVSDAYGKSHGVVVVTDCNGRHRFFLYWTSKRIRLFAKWNMYRCVFKHLGV